MHAAAEEEVHINLLLTLDNYSVLHFPWKLIRKSENENVITGKTVPYTLSQSTSSELQIRGSIQYN